VVIGAVTNPHRITSSLKDLSKGFDLGFSGIIGSTFKNTGEAFYLESSNNNIISGNNCQECDFKGIYLGDSSNNNISGNNCQGGGSDGITLGGSSNNTVSAIEVDKILPPSEGKLAGLVHDQTLYIIREDVIDYWKDKVRNIMENPPLSKFTSEKLSVPLGVDVTVSPYWS